MEQFGPSRRKNRLMSRNNVNSRGEGVWCTTWRYSGLSNDRRIGRSNPAPSESIVVSLCKTPNPKLPPMAAAPIGVCVNSNCKALWDARMMLDKRYISAVQSNVPNVGCLTCTAPSERDKPVLNARLHASSTRWVIQRPSSLFRRLFVQETKLCSHQNNSFNATGVRLFHQSRRGDLVKFTGMEAKRVL